MRAFSLLLLLSLGLGVSGCLGDPGGRYWVEHPQSMRSYRAKTEGVQFEGLEVDVGVYFVAGSLTIETEIFNTGAPIEVRPEGLKLMDVDGVQEPLHFFVPPERPSPVVLPTWLVFRDQVHVHFDHREDRWKRVVLEHEGITRGGVKIPVRLVMKLE